MNNNYFISESIIYFYKTNVFYCLYYGEYFGQIFLQRFFWQSWTKCSPFTGMCYPSQEDMTVVLQYIFMSIAALGPASKAKENNNDKWMWKI